MREADEGCEAGEESRVNTDQGQGVEEAGAPQGWFVQEVEGSEGVDAVEHGGGRAGEGGGMGADDAAGGDEVNAFAEEVIGAGRQACDGRGVADDDKAVWGGHAHGGDHEGAWEVMAVRDAHGHEPVAGEVEEDGAEAGFWGRGGSVTEVSRGTGAGINGGLELGVVRGGMADRDGDTELHSGMDEGECAVEFGGEGEEADMAVSEFVPVCEEGGIGGADVLFGMRTARAVERGDEGAFEMDAEDMRAQCWIGHGMGQHRQVLFVDVKCSGDNSWAEGDSAASGEKRDGAADILDGEAGVREVYAGKAIDLQINESGR